MEERLLPTFGDKRFLSCNLRRREYCFESEGVG